MKISLYILVLKLIITTLVFSIEVDGELDDAYGGALSVQQVQTGFGDPGSELDAAYSILLDDKLYLMLTGNLEPNFNKLEIFIDSESGGQNKIISNLNSNNDNWAEKFDGFTFDKGFTADYLLIVRHGFGSTQLDLDFTKLGEGGSGGMVGRFDPINSGKNGPFEASNGLVIGFNNTNSGGIGSDQGQRANQEEARSVRTGTELSIPLELIGSPKSEIRMCVMINGQGHDYLSNQFLGAMPEWTGNLGTDGLGGYLENSSLGDIDLNDFDGDQFFVITNGVRPLEIIGFESDQDLSDLSITWVSYPGVSYRVESSIDMKSWSDIEDGIVSLGESTTYTFLDVEEKEVRKFFRVVEE
ncbi:MAG: hypothetical protein CMN04_13155 [Roseibacillus sp.]|nr:hypothetical protein [Roseibacillus sp.]